MEIYGTIISRTEVEHKTETFKVQKFTLDASYRDNTSGQMYENTLEFQVTGNSIDKLAAVSDQSRVKVFFEPRGKVLEKKDKPGETFIIQNLNAWKFEILTQNPNGATNTPTQQSNAGNAYEK